MRDAMAAQKLKNPFLLLEWDLKGSLEGKFRGESKGKDRKSRHDQSGDRIRGMRFSTGIWKRVEELG